MEDFNNTKLPLFKKVDRSVFTQIDKFKTTPNYTLVQDFYNGLEEEQQRVFKGVVILVIFMLPMALLSFLWWQNANLREDYNLRVSIARKSQEILSQNRGIRDIGPNILSQNPIDSESMLTSRLSNILSGASVDLSKIQVSNFSTEMISSLISKAEADFAFTNASTDELMNILTALIQREKFRVQSVEIKKNIESNLLSGEFRAVHFSAVSTDEEEDL